MIDVPTVVCVRVGRKNIPLHDEPEIEAPCPGSVAEFVELCGSEKEALRKIWTSISLVEFASRYKKTHAGLVAELTGKETSNGRKMTRREQRLALIQDA